MICVPRFSPLLLSLAPNPLLAWHPFGTEPGVKHTHIYIYICQHSIECWCGTSDIEGDYELHGPGSCHMGCDGDESVACGALEESIPAALTRFRQLGILCDRSRDGRMCVLRQKLRAVSLGGMENQNEEFFASIKGCQATVASSGSPQAGIPLLPSALVNLCISIVHKHRAKLVSLQPTCSVPSSRWMK